MLQYMPGPFEESTAEAFFKRDTYFSIPGLIRLPLVHLVSTRNLVERCY